MMLSSAKIKLCEKTKKFEHSSFYVVCKLRAEEWRSKPSESAGLEPTWIHQCVSLAYKDKSNLIFIEIRDRDKPAAKPVAEAQSTV